MTIALCNTSHEDNLHEDDFSPFDALSSFFLHGLPKWVRYAQCDPESSNFFHDYDDAARKFPFEAEAKALCAKCPVKQACLEMSLETLDIYSIAGGLTPVERAKKFPKVFNVNINTHSRESYPTATYMQRNGRHIQRRVYFRKPTREQKISSIFHEDNQFALDFGVEIVTWEDKNQQLAFLPPSFDSDAHKSFLITPNKPSLLGAKSAAINDHDSDMDDDSDDDHQIGFDYPSQFRQTLRFQRRKVMR